MKNPADLTTAQGTPASPDETPTIAPDATSADAPSVGTQIDRYTVLEQLGAGGMGEVYAAFDNKLDRKVALKLLRHHSDEYEVRLMREAQAMARLLHPNVVAVFDTGVTGNRLYLAMEFVRGKTLRSWQREETRSLEDVLRVYREAGQGLAAAHAVGLVHRDFKPDNVLIADDGRVKVTDFGIARATGEQTSPLASGKRPSSRPPPGSEEAPSASANTLSSGGSLANPMTEEGTLLGTPGYMAPEQFLCEAVDERTDQFAFCVSLYEALYGARPFGGNLGKSSLERIAQATVLGKVDEPPKGSTVPAHVRRVLLRGLSPERMSRYPSMRALLEDLGRDPRRRRVQVVGAGAVVALAAVACASMAAGASRQRASLRAGCALEASVIYTHWDAPRRAALRTAMLDSEGERGSGRAERTMRALDEFATAWKGEQESSCVATRLARAQTEDVHERRSACLLGARQRFDAVLDILGEGDANVQRHALDMTGRVLLPPRLCSGRDGERLFTPLPSNPERRARVENARSLISRARVTMFSGRVKEASELAEKAAALAREGGSKADEGAALVMAATALSKRMEPAAALARAEAALEAAEAAGDDHTAAAAAQTFAYELGVRLERPNDARPWLALARSKLERMGRDDSVEMSQHRIAGAIAKTKGDYAEALDEYGKSLALARSLFGPAAMDVCMGLTNQAGTRADARDYEGALEVARESVKCLADAQGADSPEVALPHLIIGGSLECLGRSAEAALAFRTVVEHRRELGPNDAVATEALASMAFAEVELGRLEEGEADARRALQAVESHGGDARLRAVSENYAHAHALHALGKARAAAGDAKGARAQCGRAVAELEAMKAFDPESFLGRDPHLCLGEAELALGEVAEARSHLEQSVTLVKVSALGDLSRARFALARALAVPPKPDIPRARALAAEAREELRRDAPRNPTLASLVPEVERWLAEHLEGSR